MHTELEAMYGNIDKDVMREKLRSAGAVCERAEYSQIRYIYNLATPVLHKWVRLRSDGRTHTIAYKESGTTLHEQKELEVTVSNFEQSHELLQILGCVAVSYEETKREVWRLGEAEVTIDTWPHLEPLVEIEAPTEKLLKETSEQVGFTYADALFGTVDLLYAKKYNGRTILELKNRGGEMFRLMFGSSNPFT
jgi:adenylate cyclase, class 2